MSKVSSMLYRELKIGKKPNIIRLVLFVSLLFFFIFSSLVIFDMDDMKASFESPADYDKFVGTLRDIYAYFAILMSGIALTEDQCVGSDVSSGWMRYSYALPLTAKDRTNARMAKIFILQGISLAVGLIFLLVISIITNAPFKAEYIVIIFYSQIVAAAYNIIGDLGILRARTPEDYVKLKNRSSLIGIALATAGILIVMKKAGFSFSMLMNDENSDPSSNLNIIDISSMVSTKNLIWTIPVLIALIAAHYFICLKLFSDSTPALKTKHKTELVEKFDLSAPHNCPTGLIYKELKQNKGALLLVMFYPVFIILVAMLGIYIASGNDENFGTTEFIKALCSPLVLMAITGVGYFLVSTFILTVFHADNKKLWAFFITTTPNGIKNFIYTKYVLIFAMCGLNFLSVFFMDCILSNIKYAVIGDEMMSLSTIYIIMFFMLLFTNAFAIPMAIRYGEKKGGIMLTTAIVLLTIAAIAALLVLPEETTDAIFGWFMKLMEGDTTALTLGLLGAFNLFSVAAYMISYKISCKLFLKGVGSYDK